MQLPSLPVDDLPKFLTILGMVLFVVSFAYPEAMIYEAMSKQTQIETRQRILEIEVDELHASYELDQHLAATELEWLDQDTLLLEKRKPAIDLESARKGAAAIRAGLQDLYRAMLGEQEKTRAVSYEIRKRLVELQGESRRMEIELNRVAFFERAGRTGRWMGAAAFLTGLVFWVMRERRNGNRRVQGA